ncbi:Dihydropteroate synthase [Flagelloscypha sp. PMI_526]|nr:Dihydropteroate synthase [Flagelloscypha sp. PMI_526]
MLVAKEVFEERNQSMPALDIIRVTDLQKPRKKHPILGLWLNRIYSLIGLQCDLIVGINPCEREEKQKVAFDINLTIPTSTSSDSPELDLRSLSLSSTTYLTLEALGITLIQECSQKSPVKAAKPYALVFASSSQIEISRSFADFADVFAIPTALRLLESDALLRQDGSYIHVVDTSFLYETTPMYVTDQPPFLNGACIIETNIPAIPLVSFLKQVETKVGRVPTIRNGPRAIDLDLIFYNDDTIDTRPPHSSIDDLEGQVVVPHPRLAEREFVLRPLHDMIPDYVHPVFGTSIHQLLEKVKPDPQMKRPLRRKLAPHDLCLTLNVTPDSFSDAFSRETLQSSNTDILDIGGYSTRPGAQYVSPDEEISRVVPIIHAIRNGSEWNDPKTPISVDTFRPEVAKAAILAGATCINDDYANPSATIMEDMKALCRQYCVPVIVMHARGDAGQNKDYSDYSYAGSGEFAVVEGVRMELGEKVERMIKGQGGIRRWLVIVDPGIGFSKTVDGNLELLRRTRETTADVRIGKDELLRNPLCGYPILIGTSRKSFLGAILAEGTNGRETAPKERAWATAAAVACAVQQGALLVRIHDTKEIFDLVKVANRLR